MKTQSIKQLLYLKHLCLAMMAGLLMAPFAHGFAGGNGTKQDPFQVATPEHLNAVRDHLNAHFVQIAHIDLGTLLGSGGAGWVPVGGDDDKFAGSFDGGDFRITGLRIDRPGEMQVGLFGVLSGGGTLLRVTLESVDVTGGEEVGALCGWNDDGEILLSKVLGGAVQGDEMVGGLVGKNSGGAVIRLSAANASVAGELAVGGLAGSHGEGAEIDRSHATGPVSGFFAVGGLVGTNSNGAIRDSYARGAVNDGFTGEDAVFLGGLVGLNGMEIWEEGELVESGGGTVERCYATGVVGDGMFAGGLVGSQGHVIHVDDDFEIVAPIALGTVVASFWNTGANATGVGSGSAAGATGLSDAELRGVEPFAGAGWDLADVWHVDEDGEYPHHRISVELLKNRSFDLPDGVDWQVADDPGVLRSMIFDMEGSANLHGSYRGPLIWQDLHIHSAAGLLMRAEINLAAGFFPDDRSTEVHLEYMTNTGTIERMLLFNPENDSVGFYPDGSVFTTTVQIPWDARQVTRYVIDRAGPGEFWMLETSLKVIGMAEEPPADQFTLIYHAGPGGSIVGQASQTVEHSADGTEILAEADDGAEFHRWSDGITTNPRTDVNVQADLNVTAHFRSTGGVDIDWYASHGIAPGVGETWADLENIDWTGKGMTLREDFIAGTDPNDPRSRFAAEASVMEPGGAVTLRWSSVPGRSYGIEWSHNLATWHELESAPGVPLRVPAAAEAGHSEASFDDPSTTPGAPVFFRLRVIPHNP